MERNYVDDARFAEWFVRQREEFRPRSLFHLRGELRQKVCVCVCGACAVACLCVAVWSSCMRAYLCMCACVCAWHRFSVVATLHHVIRCDIA